MGGEKDSASSKMPMPDLLDHGVDANTAIPWSNSHPTTTNGLSDDDWEFIQHSSADSSSSNASIEKNIPLTSTRSASTISPSALETDPISSTTECGAQEIEANGAINCTDVTPSDATPTEVEGECEEQCEHEHETEQNEVLEGINYEVEQTTAPPQTLTSWIYSTFSNLRPCTRKRLKIGLFALLVVTVVALSISVKMTEGRNRRLRSEVRTLKERVDKLEEMVLTLQIEKQHIEKQHINVNDDTCYGDSCRTIPLDPPAKGRTISQSQGGTKRRPHDRTEAAAPHGTKKHHHNHNHNHNHNHRQAHHQNNNKHQTNNQHHHHHHQHKAHGFLKSLFNRFC
jgi:hypothetical protein